VVFDDHLPHESFNDTGQPRLNLMFDFLRPWRFRTSGLGFLRQRLAPEASYARSFDRVAGDR
jgi:aspartyl/asparaginyl beta-hydroxylase (cupin superfamily)